VRDVHYTNSKKLNKLSVKKSILYSYKA